MHAPIKNCIWAKHPLGDITQHFGENPALYRSYSDLGLKAHNGIDLVRPHGTHMYAIEDGIVVDVKDDAGGYGKHVRLFNKQVSREWTYGHCHFIGVRVGQQVRAGQFVATMGNTGFVVSGDTPFWTGGGNSYGGTHLHLGVREVQESPTGWAYPQSTIKIRVRNYQNGYRGSIDPIPFFFTTPRSRATRSLAEGKRSMVVYQLSVLFNTINV
jgi:murein DD-endopeptidase MepM/ murein hydrolase activator NlpD